MINITKTNFQIYMRIINFLNTMNQDKNSKNLSKLTLELKIMNKKFNELKIIFSK